MKWIEKYKLYHLPFWALYHYGWWSLYSGEPIKVASDLFSSYSIIKYLSYVLFQALGVYFCLYFLLPRYLENAKYLKFLVYTLGSIILVSSFIVGGYFLSAYYSGQNVYDMFNIDPRTPYSFFKYNSLPSTISVFTLGLSIKLAKNWLESQKSRQELEKEKLETELKFLKSQFNPHFLFNTINTVFFLIDNNPTMATETLAKFSGLLRYQLYECNERTIPIQKEIEYLKSFIELEEIRLNKNFEIQVDIDNNIGKALSISPFILMPFIENSFKHVSHHPDNINWIKIAIQVIDNTLILQVSNSTSDIYKASKGLDEYSGIGLQNVKRRLELLYKNQYNLTTESDIDIYRVSLNIKLEAIENQVQNT